MILYLDCYSGLSGDMALGALLDLGLDLDEMKRDLAQLKLSGYRLHARQEVRRGVRGTRALVEVDPSVAQPERRLAEVVDFIRGAGLAPPTESRAIAVFERLARAEARVHGVPTEAVHFHEVGAVDSIVDVVGTLIGLERLGVQQIFASAVALGYGMVRTQHGSLPVPAPATLELLAEVNAPTRPAWSPLPKGEGQPEGMPGELLTPTGAAVLAELAHFEQPAMLLERVGYGFGTRELPWPNALRAWLGRPLEPSGAFEEEVALLETNLDDVTPEHAGYAMEQLFAAGALDVFFVPTQMKKNRPGLLLAVVAPPSLARSLAELVLRETPTLGVRVRSTSRLAAPRSIEEVRTRLGTARIKVKHLGGKRYAAPEYEDAARLAREHGLPLAEVYRVIRQAAE